MSLVPTGRFRLLCRSVSCRHCVLSTRTSTVWRQSFEQSQMENSYHQSRLVYSKMARRGSLMVTIDYLLLVD